MRVRGWEGAEGKATGEGEIEREREGEDPGSG